MATPVRLQVSLADCGAACLAMILSAHGRHTTTDECTAMIGTGRDGTTGRSLVAAARRVGLSARGVHVSDTGGIDPASLPAIAHWEFDHFVVVDRIDRRGVHVIDPNHGRRTLRREEFDAGFTGVLLTFAPGPDFAVQRAARRSATRRFVRSYALGQPRLLAQIIVASLLLQVAALAVPLFSRTVVDGLAGPDASARLRAVGIGMILIVVATTALQAVRSLCVLFLQARADTALTAGFLDHLMSLPYRFFEQRGVGDLTNRLASNAVIRETLTRQTLTTALDGTTAIGLLVVVLVTDRIVGTLLIALIVVYLVLATTLGRRARELTASEIAADASAQGYLLEALNGVQSLKASGAEQRSVEHWRSLFERRQRAGLMRGRATGAIDIVSTGVQAVAPVALLWIGGQRVLRGSMSPGEMIALNAIALAALTPLMSVASSVQHLQFVASLIERLADVLDAEPERTGGVDIAGFTGSIELDEVDFRYSPQGPLAIERCSLSIPAGRTVAIVGRSGSGKSTLAGLLLMLHEPERGTIRFDGVPSTQIALQQMRRRFGVVLQEPALFSGTIHDNIALHDPSMPIDAVVAAATLASIHDEIIELPMGYATMLADRGAGLSGGQRQRIALARALASRPALLVLDEATSHLDSITEAAVDRAIRAIGCTRVVIAHRLSTIRHADEIVVLDHGRIVERGSHDELATAGGTYAALVAEQFSPTKT